MLVESQPCSNFLMDKIFSMKNFQKCLFPYKEFNNPSWKVFSKYFYISIKLLKLSKIFW